MTERDVERAYDKCDECRARGERPVTGFESMGYGDVCDCARHNGGLSAILARIELAWRGQLSVR